MNECQDRKHHSGTEKSSPAYSLSEYWIGPSDLDRIDKGTEMQLAGQEAGSKSDDSGAS